jgi:hypothetical protein
LHRKKRYKIFLFESLKTLSRSNKDQPKNDLRIVAFRSANLADKVRDYTHAAILKSGSYFSADPKRDLDRPNELNADIKDP